MCAREREDSKSLSYRKCLHIILIIILLFCSFVVDGGVKGVKGVCAYNTCVRGTTTAHIPTTLPLTTHITDNHHQSPSPSPSFSTRGNDALFLPTHIFCI